MENDKRERMVFLDWWRAIAIFMVLLIHAGEPFYLDSEGTAIESLSDAAWLAAIGSALRAAVPLFVIASAWLLFPTRLATGEFLKRRMKRVLIPFALWTCVYMAMQGGDWRQLFFNFPMDYGHLWFVWMLFGVYLVIPVISPWAENVTKKELRAWIGVWLFTTLFPYLRSLSFHLTGSHHLFGTASWNGYSTFHYVSGFIGYVLIGLYFKRFLGDWPWRKTLVTAIPLFLVGWGIAAFGFWARVPRDFGFPFKSDIGVAINMEETWSFTAFGVALTVLAYALVLRKFSWDGAFYRKIVLPCSKASYGVYLVHMLLLPRIVQTFREGMPTPLCFFASALATLAVCTVAVLAASRIPRIGPAISGVHTSQPPQSPQHSL